MRLNQTLAGLNQAPAVRDQKNPKDVRACEHTAKALQTVIRTCERTAKGLQAVIRACERTAKGLQIVIRAASVQRRACGSADRYQGLRAYSEGPADRYQGLLVMYPFDVGGWLEINYWLSAGLQVQGA